jgi:hypothetical protein
MLFMIGPIGQGAVPQPEKGSDGTGSQQQPQQVANLHMDEAIDFKLGDVGNIESLRERVPDLNREISKYKTATARGPNESNRTESYLDSISISQAI